MRPFSSEFDARLNGLGRAFALPLLLVGLTSLLATGCENRAIGRTCTTLAEDSETVQAKDTIINDEALECPTRICIKQGQAGALGATTSPFCTAECKSDSDCDDGETRDMSNARDRRCESGFVCGVAVETTPFACKKLCLCKDFLDDGIAIDPSSCLAAMQ